MNFKKEKERCVISGVGLATPIGCEYENFWHNVLISKTVSTNKKLFIGSDEYQFVSEVDDSNMQHNLEKRYLRKLDRFSVLATSAAEKCLKNSNLVVSEKNSDRTGILIGNSFGGWAYVEEQMRALYRGDMAAVNAYIATAWFPTASQGELSIHFNIKGYSKTFSTESISAGIAFEHARDVLHNDNLDYVLAGGVEAPLTPLIYNACIENQSISHGNIALAEGAAMFMFEKDKTARVRGAKIYAEFSGCGVGKNLKESIANCLEDAEKTINEIDVVLLNNSGREELDRYELMELNTVFDKHKCIVNSVRDLYGNAISANMAMDLALACAILDKQSLPFARIRLAEEYIRMGFFANQEPESMDIKNILIIGINCNRECITLLVSKLS